MQYIEVTGFTWSISLAQQLVSQVNAWLYKLHLTRTSRQFFNLWAGLQKKIIRTFDFFWLEPGKCWPEHSNTLCGKGYFLAIKSHILTLAWSLFNSTNLKVKVKVKLIIRAPLTDIERGKLLKRLFVSLCRCGNTFVLDKVRWIPGHICVTYNGNGDK